MSVLESFEQHVGSVQRLMNFDRDVLSFAIESIEKLQQRLTQHHGKRPAIPPWLGIGVGCR